MFNHVKLASPMMSNHIERSWVMIAAVGDVWSPHSGKWRAFRHVREVFDQAAVVFANCEGVYADAVTPLKSAPLPLVAPGAAADRLHGTGISVMSCANNHILDGGWPGLLSTLDQLDAAGIVSVGAGSDARVAARPGFVSTAQGRVAFIAFCSTFPDGYNATPTRPGLNALSVEPPDFDQVTEAVTNAASVADHVFASFHWGSGLQPLVHAPYEFDLARHAIEAGARAVLCHHHHTLRGVEMYKGSPIFYGLGHFAFEIPDFDARAGPALSASLTETFGEHTMSSQPDYPLLPFHPDARLTMIGVVLLTMSGAVGAGFVPCRIGPDGGIEPLSPGTPAGDRAIAYVREATESAGLATKFQDCGLPLCLPHCQFL